MNITLATPLSRLALCLGLATPFAATSAEIVTTAASKPTAVKKVDTKKLKAKNATSSPGCEGTNSPGGKMPSPPKCPELTVNPGAKQQQ